MENFETQILQLLKDIYETYQCRQMVFELKNVKELDNDHIDQVNRYLKDTSSRKKEILININFNQFRFSTFKFTTLTIKKLPLFY